MKNAGLWCLLVAGLLAGSTVAYSADLNPWMWWFLKEKNPVAVSDAVTVAEDDPPTVIDVWSNDRRIIDGETTIDEVTQPAHGTVVNLGGDTGLTYQPDPDYCNDPPGTAPDTFTYTLTPGGSTATVSVTVTCADDPPVAVNDGAAVTEDDPATVIDVLANDTDVDDDDISIISATQPTNGTVVITGGGTGLTYQPDPDYCNDPSGTPDTFTYTLTPGGSMATVTVTVTCADDDPTAVNDAATVSEDSAANGIDVLANDTDVDGGAISVISATQPTNGTVAITGGGTGLTYQPDPDYCNDPPGTTLDTFTYTLTPGDSTATVTVTVTCIDDDPTAVADAATVSEDSGANVIAVQANDTDIDGGTNTITAVTQPVNGTVVITNGGADLAYAPNANYCNTPPGTTPDTFTYTLAPGGSTTTVTVTVTCVDDDPVAVADAATVSEDSGANTINVLANDTDLDAGPISVTSVTQPTNGTVVITNGGAGLTYAPSGDYCNNPPGTTPDTFTYTLSPGGSTATVTVTVTCVDDDPTAVDDAATVAEDSGANTVDVLVNDTDVDGGAIAITSVTQPANGTVVITGGGTGLTYSPNADYCNNPPGSTLDTFTYTLTPGGSTATVTVTVTCVDDNPTAVADAATVSEDSGANAIDVQANDTDLDGGAKTITSVTQPANGMVVITNGGVNLTYAPNANYCNTPPGTTLDTFTYTLAPGGSTTTVTVTVTCVDDNPVAVADAATVTEDSGANTIGVLVNDTDVDGGPISITSVTQPANGVVVIINGGADLTYAPSGDYCNNPPGTTPDTFTYTLTPGGSTATVTVSVTCVNDAPVLDLDADDNQGTAGSDFGVIFTEGDAATLIEDPVDATVVDVDNATLAVLTVTLTNLLEVGSETLSVDVAGTSITAVYMAATGVLTLTGPDTVANFRTVLRTVRYLNSDADPDTTPRVIAFVANDGAANSNAATATVTVIAVDDAPTAVADAATVNEDSGANTIDVLGNDTDVDGGVIAITSVTQPANGAVVITNGGADLTYASNTNYCNNPPGTTLDTFTYTLTPGGSTTTVTVTVTCVDDDPTAVADAATVVEDSGATAINVLANDTDVDAGSISVTSVTQPANGAVAITGGGTGLTYAPNANYCNTPPGTTPDTFTYTLAPGGSTTTVTVIVTCVDDNPVAVADAATVIEDSGANTIDVLANDTDVDGGPISITSVTQPVNGAVAITGGGTGLTYAPNADYCNNPPGTTLDTFTYTLTPGGSSTTVTMTVTCVDDPPTAVADAATVVEDSGANAVDVLANDTDIDGGAKSVGSVTQPTNGAVVITGGGTGLTYAPNANYCNNPPGAPLDTFTYTLTPGGLSTTVTMTVTCVNDPPMADNDSFDFIGNTDLVVDQAPPATPHALETTGTTFGVIDGDSDPVEGDAIAVSAITVGACVDNSAPLDCSDPAVGRVQMETNGRFIFTPAPGDTGATETFQYTLTDNGLPSPASTTATVTLTRFERVWYVKNDAVAGGNGTSSSPFNSVTAANLSDNDGDGDLTDDLDSAGDYIFVYFGNGTSANQSTGLVLENGQHLIGEHVGLSLNLNLNGNGAPTNLVTAVPGNRPLLDDTVVDAFEGVSARNLIPAEIVGMNLAGNINGIDWTTTAAFAGTGTFTIRDNVVRSAGSEGVDVNLAGTGAVNLAFHDNNLSSSGTALDIQETGAGLLTVTVFDDNVVSGNTGGSGIVINNAAFDSSVSAGLQTVLGGITVVGSSGNGVGGGGIVMTNVEGDLHFSNLTIHNDNGTGLGATGTGTGIQVRVNSGGANTGIVESTGGPAVSASSANLDLRLTSVRSTNSATTGVSLTNVTGTLNAASGSSITNATGTDFAISGGTANVAYAGTITDDVGQLISIASTTGGTKAFSGAITDGDDSDGSGISLTNNTGATIRFSGGLVLSTATNAAFTATGGGTVEVCDESACDPNATGGLVNKITTSTGTALNVANTTISANNLEFRSISAGTLASGPTNGIVLNTTGTSGGLKVKGTGGAGSGGTLQRTSGDAISLSNTAKVSLSSMNIVNNLGSGIRGSTVNGFVLNGCSITANGDNAASDESGIFIENLFGTASGGTYPTSITNSTISNNWEFEIQITNNAGSATTLTNLEMSGNTISADGTQPNHGNLINFLAVGTGPHNMTLNVAGGSFTGNTDTSGGKIVTATGLQCDHSGAGGTMTCNVSGATFTNNNVGPQASVAVGGAVVVDFNGNTITGTRSLGINLFADANAPFTKSISGRIRNNVVGTAGVPNSGSQLGPGIRVQNEGSVPITLVIENNTVQNTQSFQGINVNVGISIGTPLGGAATNLSIFNNSFNNIGSRAIVVQDNDVSTGAKPTVCVNMTSNLFGAGIAGQAGDGSWVRLRELSGTFNVTQATPTTAVNAAELDDQQVNGNDATGTKYAISGTPQFSQGVCPQPL